MQVDTFDSTERSRHASPFPFSEIAQKIISEVNNAQRTKKKLPPFVNYAHDRAHELMLGRTTVDDIRSVAPPANVLPWSMLIPKNCSTKILKFASRFIQFLYIDHLIPDERKQWVLHNVDWTGIEQSEHRNSMHFTNWFFDGQAYKNGKRMCVDFADKKARRENTNCQQQQFQQAGIVVPNWQLQQQQPFQPFFAASPPVVYALPPSCATAAWQQQQQPQFDARMFAPSISHAAAPAIGIFAAAEDPINWAQQQFIRSPLGQQPAAAVLSYQGMCQSQPQMPVTATMMTMAAEPLPTPTIAGADPEVISSEACMQYDLVDMLTFE